MYVKEGEWGMGKNGCGWCRKENGVRERGQRRLQGSYQWYGRDPELDREVHTWDGGERVLELGALPNMVLSHYVGVGYGEYMALSYLVMIIMHWFII